MTHKRRAIATKQAKSTGRGILGENLERKTSVLECDSNADANGCWIILRSSDKFSSLRNKIRESVTRYTPYDDSSTSKMYILQVVQRLWPGPENLFIVPSQLRANERTST
jgi:hypothetical protein